jgi:cyclic pyranopterin phosphate synthase
VVKKLSHVGPDGAARMVDVGAKPATHRVAVAEAEIAMKSATLALIRSGKNPKGSVLEVARIAGINAAKHTSSLIPLCHPLSLTKVGIEFSVKAKTRLRIVSRAEAIDRTGVEMEALTAAAVCALTVYDMCKAIDRGMEICRIRLLEKYGGKSGHFMASQAARPSRTIMRNEMRKR